MTDTLIQYCEAANEEDANEYIQFKCEVEGWRVLMPPHPIPVGVPCGKGVILSLTGFCFILHKFSTLVLEN
jgi:hypothetical protein